MNKQGLKSSNFQPRSTALSVIACQQLEVGVLVVLAVRVQVLVHGVDGVDGVLRCAFCVALMRGRSNERADTGSYMQTCRIQFPFMQVHM